MHEWAGPWPGALVTADRALDREFEERLRDSSSLAFSIAYGVLRNREDAEEVAQDAFARAYQLRDRQRFRAWLTRMTWRVAIDRWRADRRRRAREEASATDPVVATTEAVVVARERAAIVWRAIDALPSRLRLVVVLSAIEGHDTREVARLLEIPEGTVKSRLFGARKMLAERLRWLLTGAPR
jgi:RNA polymerase sigma-70 factor (ECF subfamily)